jgi:hypothetical protein
MATNPFAALGPSFVKQPIPAMYAPPPAQEYNLTGATPYQPAPSPGMAMPPGVFARPEAQAMYEQTMQSPYMPGWGGKQAPGQQPTGQAPGFYGNAGTPGQPGATPAAAGGIKAGDITPSAEAAKLARQYRKGVKAGKFGLKNALGVGLGAALSLATGGVGGAVLGAASGLYGDSKGRKAVKKQTKQFTQLMKSGLSELGFTKNKKGKWLDSDGKRINLQQAMQVLMDNGYIGGQG